jgi:oligopeptide/dipeptide ABC transporter ATP-binding protein
MSGTDPVADPAATTEPTPLLEVDELRMWFPTGRRTEPVRAVDGVSFTLDRSETLALVGESGCGKSTIGRAVLQLHRTTSGRVVFDGTDLTTLDEEALRRLRPRMQLVFQDSYASLNPRHAVGRIVAEPLRVHTDLDRRAIEARVGELLDLVGLPRRAADRYAHEFSGGQRQRVNVARALALRPDLVVLDEPTSALDVSIQAQVVNLLDDLQREFGQAYLFIAHDLSMVEHLAHRVAVMYLGHLVELAPNADLFASPRHPYTRALLAAVPVPDPVGRAERRPIPLAGELPSPQSPPSGCVFSTRCPLVEPRCRVERPLSREVAPGHRVACHVVDG